MPPQETAPEERREQAQQEEQTEFWRSLLTPPGCETDGKCNECGRCEH